jgi:hypothetical protein
MEDIQKRDFLPALAWLVLTTLNLPKQQHRARSQGSTETLSSRKYYGDNGFSSQLDGPEPDYDGDCWVVGASIVGAVTSTGITLFAMIS